MRRIDSNGADSNVVVDGGGGDGGGKPILDEA